MELPIEGARHQHLAHSLNHLAHNPSHSFHCTLTIGIPTVSSASIMHSNMSVAPRLLSCDCQCADDRHTVPVAPSLDLLAAVFTAAKVLFCGGALKIALELLLLSMPAWNTLECQRPLHMTHVRNQAAFAALVLKLLQEAAPGHLTCVRDCEVAYAIGDSHILPSEWGTVQVACGHNVTQVVWLVGTVTHIQGM